MKRFAVGAWHAGACVAARRAATTVAGSFRQHGRGVAAQIPRRREAGTRRAISSSLPAPAQRRGLSAPSAGREGTSGSQSPLLATAPEDAGGDTASVVEADVQEVLELLDEKKAMDVVVLRASEIERMRVLCDCMVILSCTSRRHMKIVAEHVVDHFRLKGMLVEQEDEDGRVKRLPPSIEDAHSDEWMLVDLQHIIVQILSREGRDKVGES